MSTCPKTTIINKTKIWDKYDDLAYKRATYVCSNNKRYKKHPCLKIFTKMKKDVYRAICGKKNK